jgi:N-acyl-D-aspartate/D-glutamate deacylase
MSRIPLCTCLILAAILPLVPETSAGDPPYDLVLRNGRIVDGTGNPAFAGDLAIKGSKIAALGKISAGAGRREIDVKGLIVAPGFIDMHSHSDFTILEDGRAMSKILQGVTTDVLGESSSAGPYQGQLTPRSFTINGKPAKWTTLGGYFDTVDKAAPSINIVSFVGLGTVWRCVMGDSHARPTKQQFDEMKRLVEEAMKNGARGLSCMLAAPPDALATKEEIVDLCKIVARYGGIFATHMRNEGTGVFDAVREALEIGRLAGITVEIIHIKIADQQYWGRMNQVVELIDEARKKGQIVGANLYPYTRGNNNLATIIPPWAHEGGSGKMLERLKDAKERAKIRKDVTGGIPGWYNHYTAVGGDWSRMLISANNSYKGLTMDRILAERTMGKKADLLNEFFDFLVEEGGSVSTVYDHHTEKDMNLAMQQPWCSFGSDGYAIATDGVTRRGHPHPRSFGTFPRVLGVYVRQKGLLRLEDAVRKMTSQNAAKLGLFDRGILRPGMAADVTVFDAVRVMDRATYTDPFQYSVGIEHVMVNGALVLENGKHTGARPGKAMRHDPR